MEAGPTIEVTEAIVIKVEEQGEITLTTVAETEPEPTPEEETK